LPELMYQYDTKPELLKKIFSQSELTRQQVDEVGIISSLYWLYICCQFIWSATLFFQAIN